MTGLAINVSMATCIKVPLANLCLAVLPLLITIALLSKDPPIHSCRASVCFVPFSWLLQLHVCPEDIFMMIKGGGNRLDCRKSIGLSRSLLFYFFLGKLAKTSHLYQFYMFRV